MTKEQTKTLCQPIKQAKLREEFVTHPELAGIRGYCNQVFANKIAEWWLAKLSQAKLETLEATIKEVEDWFTKAPQYRTKEALLQTLQADLTLLKNER